MKKVITINEAKERLKFMCSRSERCLFDVRQKLAAWNLLEEYENVSGELLAENYINEERYTNSFTNDKIKFGKWGRQKVKYNLKMKGINDTIIESSISGFSDSDYIEMVEKEILKKNKTLKETDKYKRLQKIMAFAAQRGYEQDITLKIANENNISY